MRRFALTLPFVLLTACAYEPRVTAPSDPVRNNAEECRVSCERDVARCGDQTAAVRVESAPPIFGQKGDCQRSLRQCLEACRRS